jgi:hypothetical protein
MASADGYVLPKPGIPKTLGILNIIFGVLGLLVGLCGLGGMLIAPAFLQFAEKTAKEAQTKVEAREKAELKDIDDRIAAAKTDEEKKAIEQERVNTAANQPKMNPVDLSAATDILKNPTILGYTYAVYFTSLVLSIVALIAGIGLVRLTAWGRKLALWEAGLRIVQILIFLVINIALVLPISQAAGEKQIARMEEAAKAPGAGQAEAGVLQMNKAMAGMAIPIYPIIVLILLNNKGARAACLPKKLENIDDI